MKVYTDYQDGQTWIDIHPTTTPVEIWWWQWQLFRVFRWVGNKVHQWIQNLDNRAYEELKNL